MSAWLLHNFWDTLRDNCEDNYGDIYMDNFGDSFEDNFGANFWVNFEVYGWNNVVVNFGNNFSGSWQGGSHKTGKFVIYYAGYGTKRFFSLIFYLELQRVLALCNFWFRGKFENAKNGIR